MTANDAVKRVEEKKESLHDGIINLVSNELAHKAKVQREYDESRAKIEAMVTTRVASSGAKIAATRDSLTAGLDATRDSSPIDVMGAF